MNQPQFEQAFQRYEQGDRDSARDICLNILQSNPDHVRALQLLSIVAADRGRLKPAIELLQRAIKLQPNNAEQRKNMGVLLQRAGRPDAAIMALERAVKIDPNFVDALYDLGTVLIERGRVDEGIQFYHRVLQVDPKNILVYLNLGFVQGKRGELQEAIENYKKVLEIEPENHLAMARLGETYNLLGDLQAAQSSYRNAMHHGAGDAIKILSKMVLPPIYDSLDHVRRTRRELVGAVDSLANESLSIHDPIVEQAGIPFLLAYQGFNDCELQRKIAEIYRRSWPMKQPTLETDPSDSRKIRVGFISSFFREHTVGRVSRGLIQKLDREQFDVSVISIGHHGDELAKSIQESADDYVSVRSELKHVARIVRSKKLDVLIYMEVGMEHLTYFLSFLRLAPVQCVTWGHPQTTGVDTIDYYLSCRDFEPKNADSHYTEELVRLDAVPVYYERPTDADGSKRRADFKLSDDDHIYYCPQTLFKLHPVFDEAIAKILRADPKGRFLIPAAKREKWNEALRARFRREMSDVDQRIEFVPRLSRSEFMNLVAVSDVVMDTYPFGGGTTSLEVFVTGTPIVTRRTELMRGRFTSSYYDKMQMSEMAAHSADEYANLALRLTSEPDFRQTIREQILQRNEVLYEDMQAVKNLEAFLISVAKN